MLHRFRTLGDDHDFNDLVVQLTLGVVPEPSSMLLMGLGLAGMVIRRFRA